MGNWGDAGFIKIETNSAQSWAWVELGELINKGGGGGGGGGGYFCIIYPTFIHCIIQHLFNVLYIYSSQTGVGLTVHLSSLASIEVSLTFKNWLQKTEGRIC